MHHTPNFFFQNLLNGCETSHTCKQAADLLADVCTCPRGKKEAVKDGKIVPRLVKLLGVNNGEVLASVTNAICMIAITTEGKLVFVFCGTIIIIKVYYFFIVCLYYEYNLKRTEERGI